jgi:hypothetical protein
MNLLHRPGVFAAPVRHWYSYISADNEAAFLPAFRSTLAFRYGLGAELRALRTPRDVARMLRDLHTFLLGGMLRRRPLIKDPFAVFSAAWFAARLNCRIVITVRHPAGFVSSLKRLGWSFEMRDLLEQPRLMQDALEPHRGRMQGLHAEDVVGQAALLWTMIYEFVQGLVRQHPDFILARQEDIALEPVERFRRLYQELGLDFSPGVERLVIQSSSPENPSEASRQKVHSIHLDSRASLNTWKPRLSAEERARIRDLTGEVAQHFYPDADWD